MTTPFASSQTQKTDSGAPDQEKHASGIKEVSCDSGLHVTKAQPAELMG